MPSASCLALRNRNVGPLGLESPDDPNELAQILSGALEFGDVVTVGKGEQMIGPGCQDQLA